MKLQNEKTDAYAHWQNHRELIERYCHVIGQNTAIMRTHEGEKETLFCLNHPVCEKNGGCRNRKFRQDG